MMDCLSAELHPDAQYLAAIVESSGDAIIGIDLQGIVNSWNSGAAKLYGYSRREMSGKPVSLLLPPDRPGEESAILKRIQDGERIDPFETVRLKKNGQPVGV